MTNNRNKIIGTVKESSQNWVKVVSADQMYEFKVSATVAEFYKKGLKVDETYKLFYDEDNVIRFARKADVSEINTDNVEVTNVTDEDTKRPQKRESPYKSYSDGDRTSDILAQSALKEAVQIVIGSKNSKSKSLQENWDDVKSLHKEIFEYMTQKKYKD